MEPLFSQYILEVCLESRPWKKALVIFLGLEATDVYLRFHSYVFNDYMTFRSFADSNLVIFETHREDITSHGI